MEDFLLTVRNFADRAHGEQMRKYTPERYIVHPIRVMATCLEYTQDENMLAAALMHDVLEDTPVKAEEIHNLVERFRGAAAADDVTQLVVDLTDIFEKKNYPHWNRLKRKEMEAERLALVSARAQTIKYADILDNCIEIVAHDPAFAKIFVRECHYLMTKMEDGEPQLRDNVLTALGRLI